jgi:hypothetical protein
VRYRPHIDAVSLDARSRRCARASNGAPNRASRSPMMLAGKGAEDDLKNRNAVLPGLLLRDV